MTDRQKAKLRDLRKEIDAKLEHSDAVVLGRGDWKMVKRAIEEVCGE